MIRGKKDILNKANATVLNFINQRNEMLKLYYDFGKIKDKKKADVKRFCDTLIDYVSFGHFCVYETLIKKSALDAGIKNNTYAQISQTTEIALTFNDKYETYHDENSIEVLQNDLSILGEALCIRLELEDCLLGTI
ncbi:MAG: Rsd/AlgQ family anti-sigma factor [Gammaproteobacteria bacterium]|nr:MAG: Rsd/AlgQ family anti-sigma factor [Gammaproteobacteria bacterium]